MSNESALKKEFKNSDIQRVRNLVNKDFSSKTKIQTGYKNSTKRYKEGDIWVDKGKKWTIKNGLKQNITKLDSAKKAIRTPLTCPKCGKPMKHHLDKKMYKIHGFCLDCTVDMEHKLKMAGLHGKYVTRIKQGNIRHFIKDVEDWSLSLVNNESNFVTEAGDIEKWKSNSAKTKEVLKNIQQYIKHLSEHLK